MAIEHFDESPLQRIRSSFPLRLPQLLNALGSLKAVDGKIPAQEGNCNTVKSLFPHTYGRAVVNFSKDFPASSLAKKVGVVLSGGQAPGGHNVIAGLFDALKHLNPQTELYGFLDGPKGIIDNRAIPITDVLITPYRNQGGFDLIGSGRTKIETLEQFQGAKKTAHALDLDGIVIIGGDDSNTNAAFLAEYFLSVGCKTAVVGVPKTIDGDLKNAYIETSFGFDTACKTYAEIIGNISRDALSAKKYYFFIKMMGRSASHITLECALQTHPNMALIGEEIKAKGKTLREVVCDLADMIAERAALGKDYGVVLIPEGVIEFIPEIAQLVGELSSFHEKKIETSQLSKQAAACFTSLPADIQNQLLFERDPHGNIQVSKIETERFLSEMVANELKTRKSKGVYSGKFNPQLFFCGYEGRSAFPTNFDCLYCYALGATSAVLVNNGLTGYMSAVRNLAYPIEEWVPCGIPLTAMMTEEMRGGKERLVIRKALVDLNGQLFSDYCKKREDWRLHDAYRFPGPIQFFGPEEITNTITETLKSLCC